MAVAMDVQVYVQMRTHKGGLCCVCMSTHRGLCYVSKLSHRDECRIPTLPNNGRGAYLVSKLARVRIFLVSALAHIGAVHV